MYSSFNWIKASRPQTLTASLAPIIPTSVLCFKQHYFKFEIFLATLIAGLMLQILANFINDLYDFKKGSDRDDRIGPERMVQTGKITEKEMKNGIFTVFIVTLLVGFYLVNIGGLPILIIGVSSFIFAYLYTATKISIAYNGLGEVFVFLYFGIIASTGTFYLQSLQFSWESFIIGMISGSLNTTLLIINNLRDYKEDSISNKKTLVVTFGFLFGKIELILMMLFSYGSLFYLFTLEKPNNILFAYIPLFIFAMFIIFKLFYYKQFLSRALPFASMHILLFIIILSIAIVA